MPAEFSRPSDEGMFCLAGDTVSCLSDADIDALIREDLGGDDLTTRTLAIGARAGRMQFRARQPMVAACLPEAARMLERLGCGARCLAEPGVILAAGTPLLEARGSAASLHAGWKSAQTLVEWASGIATATRALVDAARTARPDIAVHCTRKTVPMTRALAARAVLAGGGEIHRRGLFDTVMLFPEHRAFLDRPADIAAAVVALRRRLPERAIMVEVVTETEALAAAEAFVDVIQLEKFTPEAAARVVAAVVRRPDGRPVIAAAGGVTAANASAYAASGVDVLVTSAPYYAPPQDVQVTILPNT